MRLHCLSDLHTEGLPFTLPDVDADVLILAGDITTIEKHGLGLVQGWAKARPVIYVPGNHEYYHGIFCDTVIRRLPVYGGLHVLECAPWTMGDVRFLGLTLWTDFNLDHNPEEAMCEAEYWMNDYDLIRYYDMYGGIRKLLPRDTQNWNRYSVQWLEGKLEEKWNGKTVVVTHHLPSRLSIAPEYKDSALNPAFASNLDYLFPKVDLWIHGHTHQAIQYESQGCRVVCNPRGYAREIGHNGFDPRLVVEI